MTRYPVILALLILWAVLWLGSIAVPALVAPTGDGFTRGLNRIGYFMGFQLGAGMIGVIVMILRPTTGRLRWIALIPVSLAGLLILAIGAVILWARMHNPDPGPRPMPPKPATEAVSPTGPATAPAD